MAIWQFTFHLVPRQAVERHHGTSVLILDAYRPIDLDNWVEDSRSINYWEECSPLSYAAEVERLMPPRKSWAADALMFGDEKGDDMDLWDDDIRVRLHAGQFKPDLARRIVSFAVKHDLVLAMAQTGRLIPPVYEKLIKEMRCSRAAEFVSSPMDTLRRIADETP